MLGGESSERRGGAVLMAYNGKQRRGTEFGGASQQNTLQPRASVSDMKPKEQARLIKMTGQDSDPDAPANMRNFLGQAGPKAPRY